MTLTLDRPQSSSATAAKDRLYYALDGWRELASQAREPVNNVYVRDGDDIHQLEHHVRHSPTGFAWGYGGSGPAELARCILIDHLGFNPLPTIYQHFKTAFVMTWPQDQGWRVSSREIDEWLEANYPDAELEERRT